ncbi:helix-turn-helix transcriptional regulator [uncultured Pseudoteredinibacter sp.]|uniref:helix-turn-helix domain-containing protein n=1 Tax=uncultured Pseudoteredinibacter sp. TaxID=1641701 RepID=UPI0026266CA6|nr:helix-turn-helix transcriptional regulator [uncultured Pseudoteredinibacter sp.]
MSTETPDMTLDLEPSEDHKAYLPFGHLLKFWRGVHRQSQEKLAHALQSSPRHISRLENGRVHPSKAMVEGIAQALSLGERDTYHLMISAGYMPATKKADFHAPELKWLRKAMILTLRALDPYPVTLMDSSSNILMVNRGWVGFYQKIIATESLNQVSNHFDFLFSHQSADNLMSSWQDTLSVILMSLQQAALLSGDLEKQAMVDRLTTSPNVPKDWRQRGAKLEPMASFRVQLEFKGELQPFFNVSQTVGALGPNAFVSEPQLSVNTLYPEDESLDLAGLIEGELKHPLLFY